MPTSVALSPYFETFVKAQVSAGRFNNVSEVVRAGLRLLEEQEQAKTVKLQELRLAIQAGTTSGPGLDAAAFFERLESKYKQAANLSQS